MSSTTQSHALYGCLLGGAYGDALGLPYEGLSARRSKRLFRHSQTFNLLPFAYGMVSDDTEHAVMTVQAWLAARHSNNPAQQFAKSLRWRLRLWLLQLPAGIGLATGRALFRLWLFLPTSGVFSAGNGGAMRASVLGVLCDDINTLKQTIRLSTEMTHTDPKAYQGALVIALCAWYAYRQPQIDNDDLGRFILSHLDDDELKGYLHQALLAHKTDITLSDFMYTIFGQNSVSGYMYHTVPAVWFTYLRHRHTPQQGLQCLIEAGGDVDTTCAIAGGIWGIQYGEQIQASITGKLLEPKLTPRFFYRLSQQLTLPTANKPPHFGGIMTLIRNLCFLVIVLLHGLRRLFPPY